jgi:RimJ/RimL family protein N-acetyltransferase
MLIFFLGDVPVGQIRVDLEVDIQCASVDFSVDKVYRGQGIGKHMVATIITLLRKAGNIKNLKAMVREGNAASVSAFKASGFRYLRQLEIKGGSFDEFKLEF